MSTMTATTARRRWSAFLKQLQVGPVHIQKYGAPKAVAISPELYETLTSQFNERRASSDRGRTK